MSSRPLLRTIAAAALLPLAVACDDRSPTETDLTPVPIETLVGTSLAVTLDPTGRAPLSARVTFESSQPARAIVTILGDEPLEHDFAASGTEHELPVLGLRAGTANRVELRLETSSTVAVDTLEIETEPLPESFPEISIETADRGRMEPGWTLSTLSIGTGERFMTMPVMFDAAGEIRWILDLSDFGDFVTPVEPLANGNLRFGFGSSVYEMDMLGREVGRWNFPGWRFHHDVIEKPDGNFLAAVDLEGASTIHDHIIEVDRNGGGVVREWDFRQVMDIHRRDFTAADDNNWMHMNSLWYLEDEDALIVSSRNQSAIVKVTGENELVWILGARQGWGEAGPDGDGLDTSEFLLTAVDAEGTPYPDAVQSGAEDAPDFRWPWGQHTPVILPNGNLFLFDNGFHRNFSPAGPRFSRGVEYAIDEEAMTVRQVWSYGEERGEDFYAAIVSDVDHLPETGNRLISPGVGFEGESRAWVTEVTHPDAEVVFEAKFLFRNAFSAGVMQWGDFDFVYRSERMWPYPQGGN